MHLPKFLYEECESDGQINKHHCVLKLFSSENIKKRPFCIFMLEYLEIRIS